MEQKTIDTINEKLALIFEKQSHHAAIYNAIYDLFFHCDYSLVLNVGGIELKMYDNPESESVWSLGVSANGELYGFDDLYSRGKGPGTYAELFVGYYDIIDGFADLICEDFNL